MPRLGIPLLSDTRRRGLYGWTSGARLWRRWRRAVFFAARRNGGVVEADRAHRESDEDGAAECLVARVLGHVHRADARVRLGERVLRLRAREESELVNAAVEALEVREAADGRAAGAGDKLEELLLLAVGEGADGTPEPAEHLIGPLHPTRARTVSLPVGRVDRRLAGEEARQVGRVDELRQLLRDVPRHRHVEAAAHSLTLLADAAEEAPLAHEADEVGLVLLGDAHLRAVGHEVDALEAAAAAPRRAVAHHVGEVEA
mmetsp:Transcript_40123/g.99450  ORF Transcript_40123/g.99450 Transcript_40123/m.99450 type:complete len:259 (+) Transcript_40123:384-1160(+)